MIEFILILTIFYRRPTRTLSVLLTEHREQIHCRALSKSNPGTSFLSLSQHRAYSKIAEKSKCLSGGLDESALRDLAESCLDAVLLLERRTIEATLGEIVLVPL